MDDSKKLKGKDLINIGIFTAQFLCLCLAELFLCSLDSIFKLRG